MPRLPRISSRHGYGNHLCAAHQPIRKAEIATQLEPEECRNARPAAHLEPAQIQKSQPSEGHTNHRNMQNHIFSSYFPQFVSRVLVSHILNGFHFFSIQR